MQTKAEKLHIWSKVQKSFLPKQKALFSKAVNT